MRLARLGSLVLGVVAGGAVARLMLGEPIIQGFVLQLALGSPRLSFSGVVLCLPLLALLSLLHEWRWRHARTVLLGTCAFLLSLICNLLDAAFMIASIFYGVRVPLIEAVDTAVVLAFITAECVASFLVMRWCRSTRRVSVLLCGLIPPLAALEFVDDYRVLRLGLLAYVLLLVLALPIRVPREVKRLPYVLSFTLLGFAILPLAGVQGQLETSTGRQEDALLLGYIGDKVTDRARLDLQRRDGRWQGTFTTPDTAALTDTYYLRLPRGSFATADTVTTLPFQGTDRYRYGYGDVVVLNGPSRPAEFTWNPSAKRLGLGRTQISLDVHPMSGSDLGNYLTGAGEGITPVASLPTDIVVQYSEPGVLMDETQRPEGASLRPSPGEAEARWFFEGEETLQVAFATTSIAWSVIDTQSWNIALLGAGLLLALTANQVGAVSGSKRRVPEERVVTTAPEALRTQAAAVEPRKRIFTTALLILAAYLLGVRRSSNGSEAGDGGVLPTLKH